MSVYTTFILDVEDSVIILSVLEHSFLSRVV